ncbi:hypothetical protein Tco_0664734 [Tanacetum coccineum]
MRLTISLEARLVHSCFCDLDLEPSSFDFEFLRSLSYGFAAVLAVLVTGASQSRQCGRVLLERVRHLTVTSVLVTGLRSQSMHNMRGCGKSESEVTIYPIESSIRVQLSYVQIPLIFIVTVNTVKYHSDVLARSQG